jgi:predicted alpha/beta hydrolase family esterase
MKSVIIFHGTGSTPASYWQPYVKEKLEARGYDVQIPTLPNTDNPKISEQLTFALKNFTYGEDTILFGHSSGVSLILSILERIDARIAKAIFVAGFFEPLDPPRPEPMVQQNYDWEVIKEHCGQFVVINSDNDPWGCTDVVGNKLAEKVGGKFVLAKGQGHMGSATYNQLYKEFPLLLDQIA